MLDMSWHNPEWVDFEDGILPREINPLPDPETAKKWDPIDDDMPTEEELKKQIKENMQLGDIEVKFDNSVKVDNCEFDKNFNMDDAMNGR